MSILTIMIINVVAAGILSAILAAVMLAPVRHSRESVSRSVSAAELRARLLV